MSLPVNQVIVGDCAEVMQTWPADSIDLVVTSPPYWSLRDYGSETVRVWGGLPECEHEWGNELIKKTRGTAKGSTAQVGNQLREIQGTEVKQGNFCVKCGAWMGSLGLEPHPQMYIDHLVEICRKIRRVLKLSGTFWLNIGDTYYGSHAGKIPQAKNPRVKIPEPPSSIAKGNWLQPKQLLGIPWRTATALQHDGWLLRNDIIWHKPNHMPSSVRDRLTNAYEHIFLFAKARRYYFDLDAIRKPHTSDGEYRNKLRAGKEKYTGKGAWSIHEFGSTSVFNMGSSIHPKGKNPGDIWEIKEEKLTKHDIAVGRIGNFSYTDPLHTKEYHPKGKNPGDLWRIPTTPFPGAHFATFPPKLITPIIKAGSPRWICSRCGKPRTRITEDGLSFKDREIQEAGLSETRYNPDEAHNPHSLAFRRQAYRKLGLEGPPPKKTVGWSDCGCGEGWVGGVVLDPFAGSGTALRVARKLGRRFIGIEINQDYAAMCERRLRADTYKPPPEGVKPLTEIFENE